MSVINGQDEIQDWADWEQKCRQVWIKYRAEELKDEDLSKHEYDLFCGKHIFKKGAKKGFVEYTGMIYKENEKFFDYTNKTRKSKTIFQEIQDGGEKAYSGRIL